ncbi:MAG: transporter [Steroidobacteraceae bacterium]|jgi:sugar (glycoside-pentoside-hexuronide) transporter|nr:transporter [Steroidobacteraceae bacterium]
MTTSTERLSVGEKIGYSLGDLAANLIFQTFITFLAFFYTDIYKIPAGTASAIIFWGGVFGGVVFNPIMGLIADRTNTRWGKFRPWVLWTAVPFGVLSLLAFSTPDLGENGKIWYAAITYTLLVTIYAANNLPYAALSGVLTGNMSERNSLSSYRFVAVMVAQFVIQVLLLPLVLALGDGDQAVGFRRTMMGFAIIGTIFFIITFLTTKERVPTPKQKSTIKEDLVDLFRNKPWLLMLVVIVMVFINLALKGGSYIYYFQYYVDRAALTQFLDGIGFHGDPVSTGFGIFNGGGIIMMIVGIGFTRKLADRFGKRNVFSAGLFASTLFLLAFVFFPPDAIGTMMVSQILHGFFYGITIPLLWAMIADVADYSEWKNNRRATAIVFSAMILGLKFGLAVGGALVAKLLDVYGYVRDAAVQSPEVVQGVKLSISIYASIPFLICCVILFFYEINKQMETRIETELAQRRRAAS